ncbi:hypothetical protein SAE01_32710 [Segetibacter aerophilus]|uniref:Uncharacterized protein n=2 Tax=Segetibacter aerophilus TaxID=670293 RepID=A0A512BFW8_9BACT|nr:hypothetical protein SAE01_32710 [Segetibacter aerophilus]
MQVNNPSILHTIITRLSRLKLWLILNVFSKAMIINMRFLRIKIIGVLLTGAIVSSIPTLAQTRTELKEADKHIGETVTVCGTIISVKHLYNVKDKPILVNLGNVTQHLDVIIATEEGSIASLSADSLQYKDACVTGKIYYFKGTEHVYLKAENIKLKESEIVASVAFKEKEAEQFSTPYILSATEKSNVKKTIALDSKRPDPKSTALLIRYIKLGKIVSFKEKKGKKIYIVQFKEYKKN